MAVFNKLVRDKIPELIEQAGKKGTFRILGVEEFKKELMKKVAEEAKEFQGDSELEDTAYAIAEILETLYTLADCYQISQEDLDEKRKMRSNSRGSFAQRLFLMELDD
ncbi:phosphoribosyl-ATP pyrophosphohydrolase [Fictibacillus iocasae]|uniref:Phosphoribosyl-ATP pyrophosphohydrolase n=1 Tax=Fictibacillus iocasae TaxID=2715437 RepID=A0ABW2NRF1_9BACL